MKSERSEGENWRRGEGRGEERKDRGMEEKEKGRGGEGKGRKFMPMPVLIIPKFVRATDLIT